MNQIIDFFPRLINMSAIASIVILFVLAVRLILKRAPKIFSYALWAIVLIRLLVPIYIPSPVSMIPDILTASNFEINEALPDFEFETFGDRYENRINLQHAIDTNNPVTVRVGHLLEPTEYLAIAWMIGMGIMLLYSAISYQQICRKLKVVVPLRDNIFISDDTKSPFVIGFFIPKIYLPCNLGEKEQEYIIIHEQHHIRRFDHGIKALAFLALTIHWFNPLVWIAFVLACKDMEMSCDEAVIRKLGNDVRADYSASLLTLATGHRIISGTPLAFGEGETMSRIKNISRWKKPTIWGVFFCVTLCLISFFCLLTNPETYKTIELPQEPAETIEIALLNDPLPDGYYEERDDDGNIIFTDGSNTVGGVLCYRIPEGFYDPDEHIEVILYRMGIPDYMDPSLYFRGGMTSGDNGWLAEFESDVPEGEDPTVYRRHHFYPIEGVVYDIWFDMILLDYEAAEEIRVCVNLPSE